MNRQSNNNRDNTIALYLRISRDDDSNDESNSIVTQRKLLAKVAKEKGYTNLIEFVDDGVTGTSRDRNEFNRMITTIESGFAPFTAVIVKDLSRFARDHIRADMLIEETFPTHDIRLISVSEGLDTANGEDEFTPFRNLMNEWYARDISKKRKLTNMVKGNAGEPLSPPPYGYVKDPDSPKRWIIDEEAAGVVRRVFQMFLGGKGSEQIAGILTEDKVLNPTHYWKNKGVNRGGLKASADPCFWNGSAVRKMLARQEYCGDVINFKTYSKSFKLKKRIANTEENLMVFKDVHEPIICREDFERVQGKRSTMRQRRTLDGDKNMFSGLLVCADCGFNLNYHFNQANPDIKYFNCSGYNTRRGDCSTSHYIRVDFLEQVMLGEIKRLMKYACKHEMEFAEAVMGFAEQSSIDECERMKKDLAKLQSRDRELDVLFSRIYEDNVNAKIDDIRFAKLSKQYGLEQKDIAEKSGVLECEIAKHTDKAMTADMFLSTVRKYTRARKLTYEMLTELVDKIEVHQSEKIDGIHQQKLTIYYNCVGTIEIPEKKSLQVPDVTMNTRKGVTVGYSKAQKSCA